MKMKLIHSPYVLLRISSIPFKTIESLSDNNLSNLIFDIRENQKILDNLRLNLCNLLYELIYRETNKSYLQKFLNLKRSIFNKKRLILKDYEYLVKSMPAKDRNVLDQYYEIDNKIRNQIEEGTVYVNELFKIKRNELKLLTQNKYFLNGLLHSSHTMLNSIDKYYNFCETQYTKDYVKIETNILKYLTRVVTKTTPLSTFTKIGICKLMNLKDDILISSIDNTLSATSCEKLNSIIFYFIKSNLEKSRVFTPYLPIQLNHSIKFEDNYLCYLQNRNNVNIIHKIKINDTIKIIISIFNNADDVVTLSYIIKKFNDLNDQATIDKLMTYLDKLIEVGFLFFDFGMTGIETKWEERLSEFLSEKIDEKYLTREILHTLDLLSVKNLFTEDSSINQKKQYLQNSEKNLNRLIDHLSQIEDRKQATIISNNANDESTKILNNTKVKSEHIYYDDFIIKSDIFVNKSKLEKIIESLSDFTAKIDIFDSSQYEKFKIYMFYIRKFGKYKSVNILTLFDEYIRENNGLDNSILVSNEKLEVINKAYFQFYHSRQVDLSTDISITEILNSNIFRLPFYKKWMDQLRIRLINEKQYCDIINISAVDIENNNCILQIQQKNIRGSYGAFLQFCNTEDNIPTGIINDLVGGNGKYYSRFMGDFDAAKVNKIKLSNLEIQLDDEIFAELQDNSLFLANSHPPLLPYEIRISEDSSHFDKTRTEGFRINLSDINVMLDENQCDIMLMHSNLKNKIIPFDLSFQSLKTRSKIFKFINCFSVHKSFYLQGLLKNLRFELDFNGNESNLIDSKIYLFPRIKYNNNLIMRRKGWNIHSSIIPKKNTNESLFDYLLSIDKWKTQLNIPDEIYIRFIEDINDQEKNTYLKNDIDYKPQYISFKNIFLVNLFLKLVAKSTGRLYIEEMLPNSNQLTNLNNEKYISELLIEYKTL